jgi:hypothetical protein
MMICLMFSFRSGELAHQRQCSGIETFHYNGASRNTQQVMLGANVDGGWEDGSTVTKMILPCPLDSSLQLICL